MCYLIIWLKKKIEILQIRDSDEECSLMGFDWNSSLSAPFEWIDPIKKTTNDQLRPARFFHIHSKFMVIAMKKKHTIHTKIDQITIETERTVVMVHIQWKFQHLIQFEWVCKKEKCFLPQYFFHPDNNFCDCKHIRCNRHMEIILCDATAKVVFHFMSDGRRTKLSIS